MEDVRSDSAVGPVAGLTREGTFGTSNSWTIIINFSIILLLCMSVCLRNSIHLYQLLHLCNNFALVILHSQCIGHQSPQHGLLYRIVQLTNKERHLVRIKVIFMLAK